MTKPFGRSRQQTLIGKGETVTSPQVEQGSKVSEEAPSVGGSPAKYLRPGRRGSERFLVVIGSGVTEMAVCWVILDGTLRQFFESFGLPLAELAFTDEQTKDFVLQHKGVLLEEGHGTFLLRANPDGSLDVVDVDVDDQCQVEKMAFPVDHPVVWMARDCHQLIVPVAAVSRL